MGDSGISAERHRELVAENFATLTKDEFARWVAASNDSSSTIAPEGFDRVKAVLQHQTLATHDIQIGNFHGVALVDTATLPLLPKQFEAPPPSPADTYCIAPAGTKGAGMFAQRDIPVGGVILVEHPTVVIPTIIGYTGSMEQRAHMFRSLYAHLRAPAREELLSLANCKPDYACSREEGVLCTNGIEIQLPVPLAPRAPDSAYSGAFPLASRCNHSCGPNAGHYFDLETFSLRLVAWRPIRAGEEICIAYITCTESRQERRAKLEQAYSFVCHCACCDLADSRAVADSDRRRRELAKWDANHISLQQWRDDLSIPDDACIRENLAALIRVEKEGLQEVSSDYLDSLAQCYLSLGNEKQFLLWAEKARIAALNTGRDGQAAVYAQWLQPGLTARGSIWGWRKIAKARLNERR